MDRNTITGIILIFLIFVGFSIFNNSRAKKGFDEAVTAARSEIAAGNLERARTQYVNALRFKPNNPDVLEEIRKLNAQLGIDQVPQQEDTTGTTETTPVSLQTAASGTARDSAEYGAFAGSVSGEQDFITLENNKLELKIALRGGRIWSARVKEYVTHDSLPLILFSGDSTVFGFNFFTSDNRAIQTNGLYFKPVSGEKSVVVTDEPKSVTLRLYAGEDRYIEYKYTLAPDKYSTGFDVTFKNLQGVLPSNQTSMELDWQMYVPQQEKGRDNEDLYTTIKYKYFDDEVDGLRARSQKDTDTEELTTRLSWVAFTDQFFSSIVITDNFFISGSISSTKTPETEKYLRFFTTSLNVPVTPGPESTVSLKLYYGPNHISTLRKEGQQLEKVIFLGKSIIGWISRFVIVPVFNWLEKYIGSYGIIILILTILIKIVLFPLTFKSYQSTAKMAILKPQVEEIAKKYPKQEDAMKKQQATMDMYKRAGVNPMGGCLPMLL
ncbi:MAG: membrane protein insertase YidC, partial [Bacteroidales bacterium]|nr:membrane protein insertase YidC [Bacteroidales bacterium]